VPHYYFFFCRCQSYNETVEGSSATIITLVASTELGVFEGRVVGNGWVFLASAISNPLLISVIIADVINVTLPFSRVQSHGSLAFSAFSVSTSCLRVTPEGLEPGLVLA